MTYTSFQGCPLGPKREDGSIPILPLTVGHLALWLETQGAVIRNWIATQGFKAAPGTMVCVPNGQGDVERILFGLGEGADFWAFGALTQTLPAGDYHLEGTGDFFKESLAFILGAYEFTRYKKGRDKRVALACPQGVDYDRCVSQARALYLARDLINTPAEDMGPGAVVDAAQTLARAYKAKLDVITGEDLLDSNFPAIHRVGRASDRDPRFIDFHWGNPQHPRVTLVGKGVCFDSGGLDIKSASNMLLMKKDMGGAACVLALAQMIMDAKLPIALQVLIPAVDNAIAGNAMRPKDVIVMRSGKTVEISDTDAEGRLILADALAYGAEGKPELMIDFATLTGAARVALGPDVPNLFTNCDDVAQGLLDSAQVQGDPLWRMPLWAGYKSMLNSPIADLSSTGTSAYGGAITAALFLEHFVGDVPWVHIDLMAWNTKSTPGRPEGAEAMGVRAVFDYLERRYGA